MCMHLTDVDSVGQHWNLTEEEGSHLFNHKINTQVIPDQRDRLESSLVSYQNM